MELSDKEMIEMLREPRTRREGFAVLVKQYSEPLYWKVRRIVLNHEDANDVLQNAFLKVWNNLDSFQAAHSSTVSTEDDPGVAARLMSDDYFDGDEAQARLQEAVARLPEVQRTVFTLKYFDELKYSEISKILDTSEGALKASYHLAVKKITEYLHLYE